MVETIKVPESWQRLIRDIRKFSPRAIIAGGCLRDLFAGKPIKDIDIFVPDYAPALFDTVFPGTMPREVFLDEYLNGVERFGTDPAIGGVFEVVDPRTGYPVQIIFLLNYMDWTPSNILARLDFGICQVGYDGEKVHITENFAKDVLEETFTLCSTHSPERSLRRWDRLREKYPTHTLVVADYRAVEPEMQLDLDFDDETEMFWASLPVES